MLYRNLKTKLVKLELEKQALEKYVDEVMGSKIREVMEKNAFRRKNTGREKEKEKEKEGKGKKNNDNKLMLDTDIEAEEDDFREKHQHNFVKKKKTILQKLNHYLDSFLPL